MYHIKPYTADFVVKPAHIIYHLPTYHLDETNEVDNERNFYLMKDNSPKKIAGISKYDCNQKGDGKDEQQLFKRLLALSTRLDSFIASKSKKPKEGNAVKADANEKDSKPLTGGTEVAVNENNKVGKKAEKKAERKEKREIAIASKHGPKLTPAGTVQFSLKPVPSKSPDVEHSSVEPTSQIFPIHDYNSANKTEQFRCHQIKCSLRDCDRPMVNLMGRIGQNKGVHFVEGQQQPTNQKCVTFIVTFGGQDVHLIDSANSLELNGFLPVIKFIGTVIGLYNTEDTLVSTWTDKWLLTLTTNLEGLDGLARKLGVHLGPNDFLSSQHAICLADIILRAQFADTNDVLPWKKVNAANNVQLWVKRVDKALDSN